MENRVTVAIAGLARGDADQKHHLHLIDPVDLRRFLNGLWLPAEEIHQQDHVVDRDGRRNHQRPDAVQQPGFLDDEIPGNHAGPEQHAENGEPHITVAGGKFLLFQRQRISHEHRADQIQPAAQDHSFDRDQESVKETGILQQIFIGGERELYRADGMRSGP